MVNNINPEIIAPLLLGKPGLMRESLCTLLNAIQNVKISSVMDLFETDINQNNGLISNCIIIDLSEEEPDYRTLAWIEKLKNGFPQLHRLVVAASSRHIAAYLLAGADMVLERGFSLGELRQSLQELFSQKSLTKK